MTLQCTASFFSYLWYFWLYNAGHENLNLTFINWRMKCVAHRNFDLGKFSITGLLKIKMKLRQFCCSKDNWCWNSQNSLIKASSRSLPLKWEAGVLERNVLTFHLVVTSTKLEGSLASWFGVLTFASLCFLSEMIADHQIETGLLKPDLKDKVTYTLLRKHRHQTKKSNLRSLADIGKTVSSASRMFTNPDNGNVKPARRRLLSLPEPPTFAPSLRILSSSSYAFSQGHVTQSFHGPFHPTGQVCKHAGKVSLGL